MSSVDERTVRVSGSKFIPDKTYRIKLEAAAKMGYRTISIMGTRDPILIDQIDDYLANVRNTIQRRVDDAFNGEVKQSDYRLGLPCIRKERHHGRMGSKQGHNP